MSKFHFIVWYLKWKKYFEYNHWSDYIDYVLPYLFFWQTMFYLISMINKSNTVIPVITKYTSNKNNYIFTTFSFKPVNAHDIYHS